MAEMVHLYDALGEAYDLLISWESRLAREAPFFRELFAGAEVRRVLDAACGTGRHAALFSEWGLEVIGADPSAEMVRVASANASAHGARFVQAGFGELAAKVGDGFDAVVCLGNSLPYVLTRDGLLEALRDLRETLRPGGILVLHGNNYDRIIGRGERFMPLATAAKDGREYLFLRFFDFEGETLGFNVVMLIKDAGGWQMRVDSTRHRALLSEELFRLISTSGLELVAIHGSFAKEPYEPMDSDVLIVIARRPAAN